MMKVPRKVVIDLAHAFPILRQEDVALLDAVAKVDPHGRALGGMFSHEIEHRHARRGIVDVGQGHGWPGLVL